MPLLSTLSVVRSARRSPPHLLDSWFRRPIIRYTSVILAVVLNEPTKAVLIRLTTGADLIAPLARHWEIGNALSAMLKRKLITEAEAQQALVEYQKIPIRFLDVPFDETLQIVAQHLIYAYDAYFIVCARNQSSALLTLDGGLQTVARAAHISLVEVTS